MISTLPIASEDRSKWERSESRQVRPFRYADDYLRNSEISLFSDDRYTPIDVLHIDPIDRSRLAPSVRILRPSAALEREVGISKEQLRFVIIVEDRLLKRSTVVHESSVDEITDEPIDLSDSAVRSASWRGETLIHLAVVLAEDRKSSAGFARREGSWIAKKSFKIARQPNASVLPIVSLDDEDFARKGLPRDTSYFVDITDTDLNKPSTDISNLFTVYAARALVEALASDRESEVSKALAGSIYSDIVVTILIAGFANLEGDLKSDSILDNILIRLSASTSIPRDQLEARVRNGDEPDIRAIVQAHAGLTRMMISATKRRRG